VETTPLLWGSTDSPFTRFCAGAIGFNTRLGRQSGIALADLAELLFEYLSGKGGRGARDRDVFMARLPRGGRSDTPAFLREYVGEVAEPFTNSTGPA